MTVTLIEILKSKSCLTGKGIVFIHTNGEEFLSYARLYEHAVGVLHVLQQSGVQPKDEVVLQIEDNKHFLISFWACLLGGIIPVPLTVGKNDDHREKLFQVWTFLNNPFIVIGANDLNPLEIYGTARGFSGICNAIARKAIKLENLFTSAEAGAVVAPRPEDIAFIQFSSGSTGLPKGVVLTHRNVIANMEAIGQAAQYSEADSMLSWMPLTHDMGMIGFHLNPLFCGINQYLIPTHSFVRRPAIWMDKASEHKITILCSPNFGFRYLLKYLKEENRTWDLSNVRIVYNGAEPISEKLCREFNQAMEKFALRSTAMCPVYGLAEASVAVSMSSVTDEFMQVSLNRLKLNPGDHIEVIDQGDASAIFVNVGKPINHCRVRIVQEGGQALGDGVIGQIHIKGKNVTAGYYNNPAATNEVMSSKGWLNTGDLGFMQDGSLFVTGRAKDILFVNGLNYYPHDIEKEAESAEGIELNKIVIAGSFDAETQCEEILAFVFHRGSLEKFIPVARALKLHINGKFGFEINKILPVHDIPRTTSGKLKRFELVKRYQKGFFKDVERQLSNLSNGSGEGNIAPPKNDTEARLLKIWREVLNAHNIGAESKLFEIGVNSLKAANIAMEVQRAWNVYLPLAKLYDWQTIRRLATELDFLEKNKYEPIPKAKPSAYYPIASLQKRIYYAWRLDEGSVAYNIPTALVLRGRVDERKLESSLQQIVRRHDSLRITFRFEEASELKVQQLVDVRLECLYCKEENWQEKAAALIKPFDLSHGPLCRFYLLHDRDNAAFLLLLDFHHIIADGPSVYFLLKTCFNFTRDINLRRRPFHT